MRRWMMTAVPLLCAVAACSAPAFAAYPDKPVHIIVPFAPGGGNDIIARSLGEGMSRNLGQAVVVENKAGAGTVLGTEYVAGRPPDGYNILIASFAYLVNPSLLPKLPYDRAALVPVALIGRAPNILVVPPDRPWTSVPDLIAAAKAKPGVLNYGSFGNGTSSHLAGELFKMLAHVDLTHVPYKGAGPATTDLLGGRLDMMFTSVTSASPFLHNGRLKALAVTSTEHSPAYPGLPAVADTVPGFDAQSWYAILVPAGTSAEVIERLRAAITVAAAGAEFLKRSAEDGLVVKIGDASETTAFFEQEEARWRKVVTEAHIKPD